MLYFSASCSNCPTFYYFSLKKQLLYYYKLNENIIDS
jgi:hypothetical protein